MEKTPRYNVIVAKRARRMLGAHVRFMAKINPEAARKVNSKITEAARSLAVMPGRFPFFAVEHLPPNKYHAMFVEKWYLLLYQIRGKTVHVDYIVDCRQDHHEWLS